MPHPPPRKLAYRIHGAENIAQRKGISGFARIEQPDPKLPPRYFVRLKREKAAIREKPEAWASLHTAGSSWGGSIAPSGCLSTAFDDDGGVSLASSLTQDKLAAASSPPSQKRDHLRRRHQSHDHPGLANQAPPPRLVSLSPVSLERDKAPGHCAEQRQRGPPRHDATEDVAGLPPQTAPSSLLCGSITDAETGEPLELRWRKWEFPSPSRRADTARSRGGGDGPGPGDYGIKPRSWRGSTTGTRRLRAFVERVNWLDWVVDCPYFSFFKQIRCA